MGTKFNHIAVLTSGGDAPGMNAALRAVVRAASHYNVRVSGFREGYRGLIEEKIESLSARSVAHIINRGGTILKSARCDQFRTAEGRKKAADVLHRNSIDGLVVIGGDGSFSGASIFASEHDIAVVGIPGTIDNDIYGTDVTIGFDTALNTVVEAIDKIRDTATSHNRLFFVECMGRDAGFIALNAGIAGGATAIVIPESSTGQDDIVAKLSASQAAEKTSNIVLVAESGREGTVFELARSVGEAVPHYDIRVSVLGHIQRGGNPSCADRVLGSRLGVAAVEQLLADKRSIMVGTHNDTITTETLHNAITLKPGIDKSLLQVAEIVSL